MNAKRNSCKARLRTYSINLCNVVSVDEHIAFSFILLLCVKVMLLQLLVGQA